MRRGPRSNSQDKRSEETPQFGHIDKNEWLDTKEAAVFLKKFRKDGTPSVGAIKNMVYRKQLKAKKLFGRLFFYKPYLERLIQNCPTVGGNYGN
ncbi:MAG: hypothetical protein GY909_06830 [Oligoflexia bacterium]|nr:hypothetical protein [Oligoflexia bacterium]